MDKGLNCYNTDILRVEVRVLIITRKNNRNNNSWKSSEVPKK
jgi:hypothetical protein